MPSWFELIDNCQLLLGVSTVITQLIFISKRTLPFELRQSYFSPKSDSRDLCLLL